MLAPEEMKIFDHARILEFHKFYSEYHLWLETDGDRFRVSIRIYEANDGRFFFVQSHFVSTPVQEGMLSGRPLGHPDAGVALEYAVQSITTYYDEAVGLGHQPSTSWFVKNELF